MLLKQYYRYLFFALTLGINSKGIAKPIGWGKSSTYNTVPSVMVTKGQGVEK